MDVVSFRTRMVSYSIRIFRAHTVIYGQFDQYLHCLSFCWCVLDNNSNANKQVINFYLPERLKVGPDFSLGSSDTWDTDD